MSCFLDSRNSVVILSVIIIVVKIKKSYTWCLQTLYDEVSNLDWIMWWKAISSTCLHAFRVTNISMCVDILSSQLSELSLSLHISYRVCLSFIQLLSFYNLLILHTCRMHFYALISLKLALIFDANLQVWGLLSLFLSLTS